MGTVAAVGHVTFEIRQHGHRSPFLRIVQVCWAGPPSGWEKKDFHSFEELRARMVELLGELVRKEKCPSDSKAVKLCHEAITALLALATEKELDSIRELFPWSEFLDWKDLFTAQNPFAGFYLEQIINHDYFDRLIDIPDPREEAALIRSLLGFDALDNLPWWLFIVKIQARPEAQKVAYYKLLEASYREQGGFSDESGLRGELRDAHLWIGTLSEAYRKDSWRLCPLYFY
ncbi:hypothetical protein E3J85_00485 [Patescibacteria group bacterium]|nr:MAG: hypothetical protein E3J85_00485 [Patescibacteria group bacterium]